MADKFGFDQQLVTTVVTALYTCPEAATVSVDGTGTLVVDKINHIPVQTQVTSIIVTNYSAGAQTFTIHLTPASGDVAADVNRIVSNHSLTQDQTIILATGLVLKPGNTLWISSSADTTITVTLNRIEIS